MDDANRQLGNNRTKTGHLVPRENGVRFAVAIRVILNPTGLRIIP